MPNREGGYGGYQSSQPQQNRMPRKVNAPGSGKVDSTDVFYMMYYVALHGVGKDVSWEEVLAK
jgi:hypothetical protein